MKFERGKEAKTAMGVGRAANAVEVIGIDVHGVIYGKFYGEPHEETIADGWEDPRKNISFSIGGEALHHILKMMDDPQSWQKFYSEIRRLVSLRAKKILKGTKTNITWNYDEVDLRRSAFTIKSKDGESENDAKELTNLMGKDLIYKGTLYPISDDVEL